MKRNLFEYLTQLIADYIKNWFKEAQLQADKHAPPQLRWLLASEESLAIENERTKAWFKTLPDFSKTFAEEKKVLEDDNAPTMAKLFALGKVFVGTCGISLGLLHGNIHLGQMASARTTKGARFGPSEYQELFRRYPANPQRFEDDLRDQGYSEERIQYINNLAQTLPQPDILMAYQQRYKNDWSGFPEWLKVLGFRQTAIDMYVELAKRIPPIQDLIRMGVREAFDEKIAAQYQTDQDYPEPFGEWTEKQGFSDVWAKRYWRAHWELPSVGQAFEMLHRGIITDNPPNSQLDTLLRVLDVMPYWRDKLKAIAYSPYTRVDIRRMHKAKILKTYEEVLRAYRDIGYDLDKATHLADFTIAYNTEEEQAITKGEITAALRKHYITDAEAKPMLLALGYKATDADFIIGTITYQREEEKRDLSVSAVKAGYLKADKGEGWATDQLCELGYSNVGAGDMIDTWDAEKVDPVLHPTKADLLAWVKAKVILPAECYSELIKKGFTSLNAGRYLKAAGFDPDNNWQPITTKGMQ
jgi:hypothetical protein